MRLFRLAALAVAGLLAVSACSSTSTTATPQDKAVGTTKPATAAPTSPVLAFPKVNARELARVTYPREAQVVQHVPSQRTYSVDMACSAADPKTPLNWDLLVEGPNGPKSLNSGTFFCDGQEDFVSVGYPLAAGSMRLAFKNKSEKITRAYAVLRSGTAQ